MAALPVRTLFVYDGKFLVGATAGRNDNGNFVAITASKDAKDIKAVLMHPDEALEFASILITMAEEAQK